MRTITDSAPPSLRREMAELLSRYTHDATNPLINLESLIQYLQNQAGDLKHAIDSGHKANIGHLMNSAMPQTMDMMLTSASQMRRMNTALNRLYHSHCDALEDELIDLNACVNGIIKQLLAAPHIHFKTDHLPTITADSDAAQIIFHALISNAVNSIHTDQRSDIEIFASRENDGLHITIKDQGCGLIIEEIDKIYTPFYQGVKSRGDGMGIGLSIAQVLLNRYGGRIDCASKINAGSTFTIVWPLKFICE